MVKIKKINTYSISLPLRGNFSHARSSGDCANNIVVEVIVDDGKTRGYGEGAPRTYATGESQRDAVRYVDSLIRKDDFPWELEDVSQLWSFIDDLSGGKQHNSAICAVEMAILDALGKSEGRYIAEYLPMEFYIDRVIYGAAIPLAGKERVMEMCALIRSMGIRHLRIKMDDNFERNRETIEAVSSVFGNDCEIRIDPNGIWNRVVAFEHLPLLEQHKVNVVEEPMESDSPGFKEFSEAVRSMGITMMACQSAPGLEDVEKIVGEGYYQMVNVKLSRSGGFRRALKIIDFLRSKDIGFQIGCNLGESGILSSAGRALCLISGDAAYYDGSYDSFILKENVTTQNISFGPGGEAGPLEGPGLGVEVDREKLARLSESGSTATISRNPFSPRA